MVRLYQDAAPRESRKIRGRFISATADSITLRLKDGQTRTVQKTTVRKVLTYRPFVKRWQGWFALGAILLLLEAPGDLDRRTHLLITLPISAGFFFGFWQGTIYEFPPKYRTLPQADKKFGGPSQHFRKARRSGKLHRLTRSSGHTPDAVAEPSGEPPISGLLRKGSRLCEKRAE